MYAALAWILLKFYQQNEPDLTITEAKLKECIDILYIIQMNSSAIFNTEGEPIAAALFSNLSLLNHSCEPNILIEHEEKRSILYNTVGDPIKKHTPFWDFGQSVS